LPEKMEIIKKKFDRMAHVYDQQRRWVIPCLDDLYSIMAEAAEVDVSPTKILDLGAGTGLLTEKLFEKYPKAQFTLLDISEDMLNIARGRFADHPQFKYIIANYLEYEFEEEFDIVISSLSIHHLDHRDKEYLYGKIYKILNRGGIFLNADQVLANSPENEKMYQENWKRKIKSSKLGEEEKIVIFDRMKLDHPASLESNLNWLLKCGFKDVDIFYKYYNFCVLYGKKR
jgi:tRNA (cmo5U34)-methyltransferase